MPSRLRRARDLLAWTALWLVGLYALAWWLELVFGG